MTSPASNLGRRAFLGRVAAFGAACAGGSALRASAAEVPGAEPPYGVVDLGPQFTENGLGITGQDGATSCPLPSGESLWFFGDTIEGPYETIRGHDLADALSNTACLVPAQTRGRGLARHRFLTTADGARARQVVEFNEEEDPSRNRLWPIHATCVADRVFVFYHKITMRPDVDVFEDFTLNGMGIARATVGDFRFERLRAPDGSLEFWKGDQPGFGVFTEQREDGFLYLWGCFWTGMFLARAPIDRLEDLAAYEYLVDAPTRDKPERPVRWAKQFAGSAVLFDHVPNEMSAGYNPHTGSYLATHVFDRENRLVFRTSPRITGPWSEPKTFYRPPRRGAEDLFTSAKEHPEMRSADGRTVYVTYVNSAEYVPRLLEVTLPP